MNYFNFPQAIAMVVGTLGYFFSLILLLRIIITSCRVYFNPFATQILQGTDKIIKPLKPLFPKSRWDVTTPTLLFLISLIKVSILLSLSSVSLSAFGVIIFSFTDIVRIFCDIVFWAVLLIALISWVPSLAASGLASFISIVAEPLLRPIQKLIPPIAGFDISPLLAILVIQLFKLLCIAPLEQFAQMY